MSGRMLLIAWGIVAVSGCTTEQADAPESVVDIIAHRGASAYAPENTLVAFEKAVELGADWFELDCTLSKDLEIIVIHDDDMKRTTGVTGAIRDLTLEAIKKADAGSWFDESFAGETVPTLGEALDLAKGRIGVYVEIKDAGGDASLRQSLLKLGEESGAFLPDHRSDLMARIEEDGDSWKWEDNASADAARRWAFCRWRRRSWRGARITSRSIWIIRPRRRSWA